MTRPDAATCVATITNNSVEIYGPFDDEAQAVEFGCFWQHSQDDDPRWNIVMLSGLDPRPQPHPLWIESRQQAARETPGASRAAFNQLTPSQAERLALLAEELGEATQAIGKILRHGYESRRPNGGETNREALQRELGDVAAARLLLCESGDLYNSLIAMASREKQRRLKTEGRHHREASGS